jgi:molybdate transport system substrate-binding protein
MSTSKLILVALLVALFPHEAAAQAAPVQVISSVGLRSVVKKMLPQWEQEIGHPIEVRFGASAELKAQILAGQEFDLALLPAGLVDELVKEGKILAADRREIARAGIGIGIRASSLKPSIDTPEALKRVLLDAKSVTYAEKGASKADIEEMFDRLGISNEVRSKTIFQKGEGQAQASVAEGRVELVITLISEILPVQGVDLLGPLPPELQQYLSFTTGISTSSSSAAPAKILIERISDPSMAPLFKSAGLEPR